MTNVKELLPIGSVVLLKEGEKRLMIYGIKQTELESNQEFDYIGVIYPEGYLGDVGVFLFNHEDIKKVYFLGMNDMERQTFMDRLDEFYKSEDKDN